MGRIISIGRFQKIKGKEGRKWREMDRKAVDFEMAAYEGQKKREAAFRAKYQDIFDSAPDMPFPARIKYFCQVLLDLLPCLKESAFETACMAYDDFFNFYADGIDLTLSDWCRHDPKTEALMDEVVNGYPFLQVEISVENMVGLLHGTLLNIHLIHPEEGPAAKKAFLWELVRLFEICRWMLYVFSDEGASRP